jgi:membrane fusion protein (multidrug efflux system)
MRWYWQLSIIAVLGGVGYASYTNWSELRRQLPFLPALQAQANAPQGRPGGQGTPIVEVTPVGTGRIVEITEAVGTTRALESVMITGKLTGIVDAINFQEGQTVEAGQELVRLDSAEREADLMAARAAIQTAQALRQEIMQRFERARALRQSGAGTEAQVADLTLQLRTAETAIAAATARERAAAARLDDMVVRAPFSGRVGMRQVSLGALIETRTAITTLDDLSSVRLDFSVPEILLSRLRVGTMVRTRTVAYGAREFIGEVAVMDTRIDPVTRSVRLTAIVPNPEGLLRPGMFMNVSLEVAVRENAVVIPEEAIIGEGARQLVFVIANNRAERRVVEIGQRQQGRVEISEGLRPGEQIVVRGLQRVRHGLTVNARAFVPERGARPGADATAEDTVTGRPGVAN